MNKRDFLKVGGLSLAGMLTGVTNVLAEKPSMPVQPVEGIEMTNCTFSNCTFCGPFHDYFYIKVDAVLINPEFGINPRNVILPEGIDNGEFKTMLWVFDDGNHHPKTTVVQKFLGTSLWYKQCTNKFTNDYRKDAFWSWENPVLSVDDSNYSVLTPIKTNVINVPGLIVSGPRLDMIIDGVAADSIWALTPHEETGHLGAKEITFKYHVINFNNQTWTNENF